MLIFLPIANKLIPPPELVMHLMRSIHDAKTTDVRNCISSKPYRFPVSATHHVTLSAHFNSLTENRL